MLWESPSSFRRTFATSMSNYLFFKTKFQEVKNLKKSKIIIALTINRTNVKKGLWFLHAKDIIGHRSNQEKY